jgi:hypothetical protein
MGCTAAQHHCTAVTRSTGNRSRSSRAAGKHVVDGKRACTRMQNASVHRISMNRLGVQERRRCTEQHGGSIPASQMVTAE